MIAAAQRFILAGLIVLFLVGGWFASAGGPPAPAQAGDGTPGRKTVLDVTYTLSSWWLVRYSNNFILCGLKVEHAGVPNAAEIESQCGTKVATQWLASKPCNLAEIASTSCPGLYLIDRGAEEKQRKVEIELPLPSVWIEVADCNPLPGERKCSTLPNLLLRGNEPLPNETILSIQGTINGEAFSCPGGECRLPMRPTAMDGVQMEFWADSSFGDSTEHYTAKIRLMPWGDFMNPDSKTAEKRVWYLDAISSQWTGGELASCSATWQVFPGLGGPPGWLSSPDNVDGLRSDTGYYYLAAQLIHNGLVKADDCPDGGLQSVNVATACGVELAKPLLVEWQNRFDEDILKTSAETGVPASLLKGVFSRESQIWPGIFTTYKEAGLGQLTEKGADTVLLWNPDFFQQFCPLVLSKPYCDLGFANLKAPEQNLLRGALVHQVDASCKDCTAGIDISQASFSVNVFAEGLLANCEQVGKAMRNITGVEPGQSTSYEDLWRLTLVNYNAGPGCLGKALNVTLSAAEPMDWQHISSHLEPACQPAVGYVEDISGVLKVAPTPTPWLANTGPLPTLNLPRVNATPSPTPTGLMRTPTATPAISATPTKTGPTPTAQPTTQFTPTATFAP
jgi:hypothetical protein